MRRMMHKFRFQLLSRWLVDKYVPCKAADIGGGKGLLAHLLNNKGWSAVVIDPIDQKLTYKFKDIDTGKRIKLSADEQSAVPRINEKFKKDMAKDFDLLIGLHAHGSNMFILEAAKEFNKDFVVLPCCVIDEPIEKRQGINWIQSLVEYGGQLGLEVKTDKLNFVGQNILVYTDNFTDLKSGGASSGHTDLPY